MGLTSLSHLSSIIIFLNKERCKKQAYMSLILNYLLIFLPGELRRIRSEFVQRVSIPVIKGLLDDLWQQELLSTEDKDFVMEKGKIKTDMARCLIDMVIGKGEKASKEMIDSMKKRDNPLCITLGLISSPTASGPEF